MLRKTEGINGGGSDIHINAPVADVGSSQIWV